MELIIKIRILRCDNNNNNNYNNKNNKKYSDIATSKTA